MEACGHSLFERLLAELGFELGSAMPALSGRGQCASRRPTGGTRRTCCVLLLEHRFPRIWVPSLEERDVRQLLVHRHKQVQTRTRVKNQLQALALSQGVQKKRKLWTEAGRAELEQLELLPYAAERRKQLLQALDGWSGDRRAQPAGGSGSGERPAAVKLQTHPGVGPVTALAMVLTLGPAERFASGSKWAATSD